MVFGEPMQDTELAKKRENQLEFVATTESTGKVDMLRWISLGKNPAQSLKECTRYEKVYIHKVAPYYLQNLLGYSNQQCTTHVYSIYMIH